jgi:hypothetical protein
MGPKPSVVLSFSGLQDRTYYVTLLSKRGASGPWSSENEYGNYEGEDLAALAKFEGYTDADGYYFLYYFEKCQNNSAFTWGYFPPDEFKILIYFPDYDTFAVSESSYKRYAFNSYYQVDMRENNLIIEAADVIRNYDYSKETLNLVFRIILTIIIEIGIALLFKYKTKNYLKIIVLTNIITQIALNVLLNIINYTSGSFGIVLLFIALEIAVFIIEAVIYYNTFNKLNQNSNKNKSLPVLYAFAANSASFITGLLILLCIPGIF